MSKSDSIDSAESFTPPTDVVDLECRPFQIRPPIQCRPTSLYQSVPFIPTHAGTNEKKALRQTLVSFRDLSLLTSTYQRLVQFEWQLCNPPAECRIIYLSNFSIHRLFKDSLEFTNLNTLNGENMQYFDGTLHYGAASYRVEHVPFSTLAIDGYDTDEVSVANKTCIQSLACPPDVWYQLIEPAPEYALFYEPFTWLVDFTKYFVEYLLDSNDSKIGDFRHSFYDSLHAKYGVHPAFQSWKKKHPSNDFRSTVCAHIEFLCKETSDIDRDRWRHSIWRQVHHKELRAIEAQPQVSKMTIVSPFVHACFKDMYFAAKLQETTPVAAVREAQRQRRATEKFTAILDPSSWATDFAPRNIRVDEDRSIRVGDFIAMECEEGSAWKSKADYLAYVQATHGERLRILWLYRPADTTCAHMNYPFRNEIFMSSHCNCDDGRLTKADVKYRVKVSLWADPSQETQNYCIRSVYNNQSESFVTLQKQHLQCEHLQPRDTAMSRFESMYPIGSCVLFHHNRRKTLEPAEILAYHPATSAVQIRKLLRLGRDFNVEEAKENEVVYTNKTCLVRIRQVHRICHVKHYPQEQIRGDTVPSPYSYRGTGDCFILSTGLTVVDGLDILHPLLKCPRGLQEGFDPLQPIADALHGLSLFAGGGSFDRGLAEPGGVKITHAVEWEQKAAHTILANADDPENISIYHGSVNGYTQRAFGGEVSKLIAGIGSIRFICAGSPCPAFSMLQNNKNSDGSHVNASLVASLVAYVEHYLPDYGVFENVLGMASSRIVNPARVDTLHNDGTPYAGDNVFSQLICGFVALGYQVQQVMMDAWCHGSPQARSRLIVIITAPGKTPPRLPPQTHSHYEGTKQRGITNGANGLRIGARNLDQDTPFTYVPASRATHDLPELGNAVMQTCIAFPDHVVSARNRMAEVVVPWIPRDGYQPQQYRQSTLNTARLSGVMPHAASAYIFEDKFPNNAMWRGTTHKALGRVQRDRLFPTITTSVTPIDAKNGCFVHWEEHRILTVQEARRAQSIPDHEVLIGPVSNQWKIVGNSVDRMVAVALGVVIREACDANARAHPPALPPASAPAPAGMLPSPTRITTTTTVETVKTKETTSVRRTTVVTEEELPASPTAPRKAEPKTKVKPKASQHPMSTSAPTEDSGTGPSALRPRRSEVELRASPTAPRKTETKRSVKPTRAQDPKPSAGPSTRPGEAPARACARRSENVGAPLTATPASIDTARRIVKRKRSSSHDVMDSNAMNVDLSTITTSNDTTFNDSCTATKRTASPTDADSLIESADELDGSAALLCKFRGGHTPALVHPGEPATNAFDAADSDSQPDYATLPLDDGASRPLCRHCTQRIDRCCCAANHGDADHSEHDDAPHRARCRCLRCALLYDFGRSDHDDDDDDGVAGVTASGSSGRRLPRGDTIWVRP